MIPFPQPQRSLSAVFNKNSSRLDLYVWYVWNLNMSRLMKKNKKKNKTKWHVRLAKTQISLGIRQVWSESLLSAWRKLGSLATHWSYSKDSDQTGRMLSSILMGVWFPWQQSLKISTLRFVFYFTGFCLFVWGCTAHSTAKVKPVSTVLGQA